MSLLSHLLRSAVRTYARDWYSLLRSLSYGVPVPSSGLGCFKGGPEHLEKEINEILGWKREDRLSDPFFELVQATSFVRFSYLLRLCNFCKAPRDLRKLPQKCQKRAGC